MSQHLIVLKPNYLNAVLTGDKTIECRLARRPIPPYHAVQIGDILWLKVSLGPVLARAVVSDVFYHDSLTPAKIKDLRRRFNSGILGTDDYWTDRMDCRYATLICMEAVTPIEPLCPNFKLAGPWLVLKGKKESVFSSICLKSSNT